MKKKESVRPKFSEKSNTNIKILAEKTGQEMRGVENFIPKPAPEPTLAPTPREEFNDPFPDSVRSTPLFSDGFWDSACLISFVGGFISLGILIGLNLR